jgi:hypothetical protein
MTDTNQLTKTYDRLAARMSRDMKQQYEPPGPGTHLAEVVTMMAYLLGAKDPYLVVLFPEYLDAILSNTQPEWMESLTEPPKP